MDYINNNAKISLIKKYYKHSKIFLELALLNYSGYNLYILLTKSKKYKNYRLSWFDLDEIKENTEWKPFPLDETVQALVYGVKDETSSIGPFINDGNGNPLVREIQNGYYILIDRQEDQETDILDRPSFNVTVGLYDTDTNTLYCCTLDT